MKSSKQIKVWSLIGILASGLGMSASALAMGIPTPVTCRVTVETGSDAEFYVPSDRPVDYNILGWGNGAGMPIESYRALLTSVARDCVLVAASTSSDSGDGRGVKSAVKQAKYRYRRIVGHDPKICTAGHSQGGAGAFNAANLLGADCVIALQPDTVYSATIERPVAPDVDVVCIFSTGDVLAPAEPDNANNCRNNATRYSQEMTAGSHFTPTTAESSSLPGGEPGQALRTYVHKWLFN